jgi:hypothetical protein
MKQCRNEEPIRNPFLGLNNGSTLDGHADVVETSPGISGREVLKP